MANSSPQTGLHQTNSSTTSAPRSTLTLSEPNAGVSIARPGGLACQACLFHPELRGLDFGPG